MTVVHPGRTRTERLVAQVTARSQETGVPVEELERELAQNSLHRLIDASEVADVVAFLASPLSVGITGDAVAVGGGVPGAVYY